MRILVNPDQLRALSAQLQQVAGDLQGVESRVGGALGGLDWEARQKVGVEGQVAHARSQARSLAARAEEMGRYLAGKAQAFEEADGQGVGGVGQVSNVFIEAQQQWMRGPLGPWLSFPGQEVVNLMRLGELSSFSPVEVLPLLIPITPAIAGVLVATAILRDTRFTPGLDAKLWAIGREVKLWPERRGRPEMFRPEIRARMVEWDPSIAGLDREWTGATHLGGFRFGGKREVNLVRGEAGFGLGFERGRTVIGPYGKVVAFEDEASGVLGDRKFGLGAGRTLQAGELEAFAGVDLEKGRVGAVVGGTLVSAEGVIGFNVRGAHIGATGEIGLQFKLGLELGKKGKVYVGPFAIGLSIGEALGS